MAATGDISRAYEAGVEPVMNDVAFTTSAGAITIYEGTAVGIDPNTNVVEEAFDAANNFAGFAQAKAVKGTQTHVHVRSRGIIKLTVADSTDGSTTAGTDVEVGDTVYASADDTFTKTSASGMSIGKVHRVLSTSGANATCLVYFEAVSLRSV